MCEFGLGFGFTTTYYDFRLAEKSSWFVMGCVVIGSVLVLRHSIEDHYI